MYGADSLKTYKSNSGYTIQYPASWHDENTGPDFLFLFDFPPSKAVRGAVIPEGGAGIKILTPSQVIHDLKQAPRDLDEFVALATARDVVIQKRALEIEDGQRKLAVVEVQTLACCGGPPPHEESINWYFERDARMFLGTAFYGQDDPRVDKRRLRDTLRQIVLSLKVTRPDSAR